MQQSPRIIDLVWTLVTGAIATVMRCPYCKSQSIHKHGAKQRGIQPYICLDCQRSFRRRRFNVFGMMGLTVGLLFALPIITSQVLKIMQGSPDDGKPVDVIIVLGRGPQLNEERAIVATRLWKENRATQVFVSGMGDAPMLIKMLQQSGIPKEKLKGERCSQTTWENGLFSELLVSSVKNKRILLVTDPAHMARAASVFRGFGFEVLASTTRLAEARTEWTFRELAGILVYALAGKFNSRNADQLRIDQVEARYKIKTWNCSLRGVEE